MEINSKIFKLLKSFNLKEIKYFEEFLKSPFCNKNQNAIKLYDIIKEFAPDFNSTSLTKENIYNKIYGEPPFEDWRVRNLFSDLFILAEDFLAYRNIKFNTVVFEKQKIDELISRNLLQQAEKKLTKLEDEAEGLTGNNENYYLYRYNIENFKNRIYYSKYDEPNIDKVVSSNEFFKTHFLINYLKAYSNVIDINWSDSKSLVNYDSFFNSVLKYLNENSAKEHPHIQIYYLLIMSITEEKDTVHYYELKSVLEKHYKEFRNDEIFDFYLYLQNYCWKKVYTGNKDFEKELIGLYKWILENRIIEMEEHFLYTYFNNFVNAGLLNHEYNWTFKFIEDYNYRLRDEIRDIVVYYNKAKLKNRTGEQEKAIEYLSKVQPIDTYFKIHYKILQIIIYYDMNYTESAIDLNETLKKMLGRMTKLSDEYKQNFYNFAGYFQKLMLIRNKYDKNDADLVYSRIKDTSGITQKEWLIEKIKELK